MKRSRQASSRRWGRPRPRCRPRSQSNPSTTEATTEEDEVGHIVDDTIDLEQSIIDAVGLDLPFSPVCQADCPGLCPRCGIPLATAEPGHHHDEIDPRWAKLATILRPDNDGGGGE